MIAPGAQLPAIVARLCAASMALVVAATGRAGADGPVTTAALVEEMIDRSAVARLPDPGYRCIQFSSYDRASIAPTEHDTWFANGDAGHFLRVEDRDGRTEHVMVDATGPGAVVRIWSANPEGTLRVYLDDAEAPVLEWPMADILAGKGPVAPPLAHV
ncbi:MAG: hypothetical protein KDA22_15270, partial [Phycisphaerales bacterium]|nr:hypothetical protein [Phycisphaerales bacterium]